MLTLPSPAGVREAVTVGAVLAARDGDAARVASPVPPLPSETVTLAVNVPAVAYVCEGFCVVDAAVPSPKSQL